MVGSTVFCAFLLLFWFPAIRADGNSTYETISATNSSVLYFPFVDVNIDPSCSKSPEKDCYSRWWQEDNPHPETGFRQVISTRGLHTVLQLVFTKSTTIKIVAFVDGQIDTRSLVILNGRPDNILTNGPNLYGKGDLDAGSTNTLCVQYNNGSGVLRMAGFYLDAGGEVLESQDSNHPCIPSQTSSSPPGSTTTSYTSLPSTRIKPTTKSRSTSASSKSTTTLSRTPAILSQGVFSSSSYSGLSLPMTPAVETNPASSASETARESLSSQRNSGQSRDGLIAGATAAGTVLLVLACVGIYYVQRCRRRAASQEWLRTRAATRIAQWDEAHWTRRPASPAIPSSINWHKEVVVEEGEEEEDSEPSLQRERGVASPISSEMVSTHIGFTSASVGLRA